MVFTDKCLLFKHDNLDDPKGGIASGLSLSDNPETSQPAVDMAGLSSTEASRKLATSDTSAALAPSLSDPSNPLSSHTLPALTKLRSVISWTMESPEDERHFKSIPWINQLLSTPGVRAYKPEFPGRTDRGPDPMLHGILSREGGVLHSSYLVAEPWVFPPLEHLKAAKSQTTTASSQLVLSPETASKPPPRMEAFDGCPMHLDLYTLGPALHGATHTIHGGLAAVLCDMAAIKVGWMQRPPNSTIYTKQVQLEFLTPMLTDADGTMTLVVKTQLNPALSTKKKMFILGSVEGPNGKVYARAQGVIVNTPWKTRI